MIYDAHAHIGTKEERLIRKQTPIVSMICAQDPKEAVFLQQLANGSDSTWIVPTFGLHPWQSADYAFDQMLPFLEKASIIGEIGMDNVWCEIPLSRQQFIFEKQLAFACEHKKPVILHTKGQEKEIAKLIRQYPNHYLVHWYSDLNGLEDYLDQDCYFTLGPDLKKNLAVQHVLASAPFDRILVETDGWSAVEWAFEEEQKVNDNENSRLSLSALPDILLENMRYIANYHNCSLEEVTKRLEKTFHSFTGI